MDLFAIVALISFLIGYIWGNQSLKRCVIAFQNDGEAYLSKLIKINFTSPDYHLMNHVTLKVHDGSTQVDHILVSRYGIFVIETKCYSGWIFGDEKSPKWTQVLYGLRFRFQNPVFQNYKHVNALKNILDFQDPVVIKSVVVFVGDAEFKTKLPKGVFTEAGFLEFVKGHTDKVISQNRMHFCIGRIEALRQEITAKTDIEHIESLNRKYSNY